MNATPQMAKQKLAKDLRTTIDDVEELLRLTAGQVGERMGEVRNRLQSSLTESKAHLTHLQTEAIERGKQATAEAEEYVHDHPWKVVGIVGLVGVLIGALIARR